MTTPASYDLAIYQGDSYDLFFRVKARDTNGVLVYQDLTGSTVKAQYRANAASSTVLLEFSCSLSNQSTTAGGVLVHASAAQTTALAVMTGMWDCQITYPSGDVKTVLRGNVTVTTEITR